MVQQRNHHPTAQAGTDMQVEISEQHIRTDGIQCKGCPVDQIKQTGDKEDEEAEKQIAQQKEKQTADVIQQFISPAL